MTILITAQTGAANSDKFSINSGLFNSWSPFHQTATIRVTGGTLGTDEYVKLQYSDGTNWIDAETDGNDGKILDADNAVKTVYGRLDDVRVQKSATASARGVEVI